MRIRATLLPALLVGLFSACNEAPATAVDASVLEAGSPAALEQIDRVSLLAYKDVLGPKYPLTVARSDSIAMVVDFFAAKADQWDEQTALDGFPMLAGFYRDGQLESQRGFIETSHGAGGRLVILENGKFYSRTASAAEIAQFMSYFGLGVVLIPD